jgi:transcriptional regulator with XRE-family HTH domain
MAKPHLNDLQALGLAVRLLRQKSGKSQEALAHVAGVHRTYVGSVERGERNVSLKNIASFARALNCSASDLLRAAENLRAENPLDRRTRQ